MVIDFDYTRRDERLQQQPAALVCFAYSSRLAEGVDSREIVRMLSVCFKGNAARGVTGLLTFDGSRFWQVIEGSPEVVSSLAGAVMADPRHVDITVEKWSLVRSRHYASWSVAGFENAFSGVPRGKIKPTNVYQGNFGG